MKKIAFFDIDGTMVNVPEGMMHPSTRTCEVLKEFQNQGNYIVVATARTQIPESVKDIEFDGYICSDGHYIEFQGEVLVHNIFSKEQLALQLEVYENFQGSCALGGYHGNWVSTHEDPYLQKHNEIYTGSADLTGIPLVKDSWDDIAVSSVAAVFSNADSLRGAKAQLPQNWAITAYEDDTDIRMDVHLEGFSKGTACEYLYRHLNIETKNTYAFGDGHNDIEMLQLVGHGIAMGNASDKVKKHADHVTRTVNNDGIAHAFKKLLDI
ncbi:MAG: HAD family hydrolase [Erysipelotrichaceae bacterium]|nr:HAD family hydrolase [Erysipelotrichaceae bacterium]MDD3809434.1 HAD family hydrolase [Erysipelotrichaceae bacterium]